MNAVSWQGKVMSEQRSLTAETAKGDSTWLLMSCLSLYLALGVLFLAATPIQEASDEARHVGMVLFLKTRGRLANLNHDGVRLPRQESTQAPLYYALGARLVNDVDTSDARRFFRARDGSPIGRADLPGPRYMFEPTDAGFTLQGGTAGAIWRLRLFSVFLGCITLVSVWLIARRVLAGSPELACFATLLVACNPMWLFISTSVNNDNLVGAAVALTILAYARLTWADDWGSAAGWVVIGALAGIATMAKVSAVALVPALSGAILLRWRGTAALTRLAVFWGTALLVSGWWFARNLLLYGDMLALEHHVRLAGNGREEFAPLSLLREWDGFVKSFWGVFGAFNIVYPDAVYHIFFAITLLLSVAAIYRLGTRTDATRTIQVAAAALALNLVAVAAWTARVTASQGRLLFASMAPIALLAAAGTASLPRRLGRGIRLTILAFLLWSALYAGLDLIPAAYPQMELTLAAPTPSPARVGPQ